MKIATGNCNFLVEIYSWYKKQWLFVQVNLVDDEVWNQELFSS